LLIRGIGTAFSSRPLQVPSGEYINTVGN